MKKLFQSAYNFLLRDRRLRRITEIMLPSMPESADILDLGCGTGDLAAALHDKRASLKFKGLDVYPLPESRIERGLYDGVNIPYPDASFDYVMLITVLHHTDDYVPVLKEALRVTRKGIILLDHQYATRWDWLTLAFIDTPGNIPFGIYTPYNFKTRPEWKTLFSQLGMKETYHDERIFLFGKIMDVFFGRNLHFVSILEKPQ